MTTSNQTQSPQTPPMDAAAVADLTTFATAYEDRIEAIETYLADHDIFAAYNTAIGLIQRQTGASFDFWHSPFHDNRVSYDMTLTTEGLHFSGTDPENDYHSFTLPFTFLSPDTRDDWAAETRMKFTRIAAEQAESKRKSAERERAAAERALADAEARLAALNAQQ